MAEFKYSFIVDYVDTDALGVVHFSNYLRYFERAELALLRGLGFDYRYLNSDLGIGIPRVEAHCRYLSPCSFGNEVEVRLWVEDIRQKSLKYRFEVYNKSEEKLSAEGWVTIVPIDLQRFKAIELPAELKTALMPYLRQS